MFRTFGSLAPESERTETESISKMAENNTAVDFTALIRRVNELETAVHELQTVKSESQTAEKTEEHESNAEELPNPTTENDE